MSLSKTTSPKICHFLSSPLHTDAGLLNKTSYLVRMPKWVEYNSMNLVMITITGIHKASWMCFFVLLNVTLSEVHFLLIFL